MRKSGIVLTAALVVTCMAAAAGAATVTNFLVVGSRGGSFLGGNIFVACTKCTLYQYNSGDGTMKQIGPFSDDAQFKKFVYVAGSLCFNAAANEIDFVGMKNVDDDSSAAIYTIDSGTGHTIRKTPWNVSKLGNPGTLVCTGQAIQVF